MYFRCFKKPTDVTWITLMMSLFFLDKDSIPYEIYILNFINFLCIGCKEDHSLKYVSTIQN